MHHATDPDCNQFTLQLSDSLDQPPSATEADRRHLLKILDGDGVLLNEHARVLLWAGAISINTTLSTATIAVVTRAECVEACKDAIVQHEPFQVIRHLFSIKKTLFKPVEKEDERATHAVEIS